MKKRDLFLSTLYLATLVGCESKAGTGALIGGGSGAVAGAMIGGGTGAVIGGAAGAIGGAVIGAAMEEADRKALQQKNPQTLQKIDKNQQLTIDDIKSMSQAGLKENVIIGMIQKTGSRFNLTTAQVIDLKNAGVPQKVIDYMINYT